MVTKIFAVERTSPTEICLTVIIVSSEYYSALINVFYDMVKSVMKNSICANAYILQSKAFSLITRLPF